MLSKEFETNVRKVALVQYLSIYRSDASTKKTFTAEDLFSEYKKGYDTRVAGITKEEITTICDILCDGSGLMSGTATEPKQYISQMAALQDALSERIKTNSNAHH